MPGRQNALAGRGGVFRTDGTTTEGAALTRVMIERVVDGFFPLADVDAEPQTQMVAIKTMKKVEAEIVRGAILKDGQRIDGRKLDQVRPIESMVGFLPRTHGSALFTRLLTRTETITCILFYLTVMQSVFGLVCAGIDGDMALPTAQSLPWLALVGLAGLTAHFCLTKALSVAPAGVVMPMDFARLPIIGLVGMIFYLEPLSWGVIAGGILILAANWLNIRSETARRR